MSTSRSIRESHPEIDADEPTARVSPTDALAMQVAASGASGTAEDARVTRAGDAQVLASLRDLARGVPAPEMEVQPVLLVNRAAPAPTPTRDSRADDTISTRAVGRANHGRIDFWLMGGFCAAIVIGGACGVLFARYAL